jgi:hypothetical protein
MKNILSFNKYHILKESAPYDAGMGTAPVPAHNTEEEHKDYETPKRNAAVLLKKLMPELRSHLIYWFNYGKLSKLMDADADDVDLEDSGLCLWATDMNGSDENKYQWRIKIVEAEQEGMVERVERVKLILTVFDYNREYMIRTEETNIKVTKFNEDFLLSRIKRMKNTILKVPKDDKDVKKFKDREEEMFGDDIY